MSHIKIKKGHDIKISGIPESDISTGSIASELALLPSDFKGVKPKLMVKVGDSVKIGSPLFLDKLNPEVRWASPGSGIIKDIPDNTKVMGYPSKDLRQFLKVKSHTDRGKHYDQKSYNSRDFHKYKFPALNLNLDEVSCAVGSTVLKELPNIIKKRHHIAQKLNKFFLKYSKIFTLQAVPETSIPSYYFLTIEVN